MAKKKMKQKNLEMTITVMIIISIFQHDEKLQQKYCWFHCMYCIKEKTHPIYKKINPCHKQRKNSPRFIAIPNAFDWTWSHRDLEFHIDTFGMMSSSSARNCYTSHEINSKWRNIVLGDIISIKISEVYPPIVNLTPISETWGQIFPSLYVRDF